MTANSLLDETSGKMLVCSQCPKEFRYNSEKIRHEISHFPDFQCEVCAKKFSFVSALRRHQKQHERTGSVKCELCNRKFRDDALLKRHIKYSHKGTFSCSKCGSQFSSDQALQSHMKTHRPESERRFKCRFEGCVKTFNFSHHLKHHELTHTNEKQHFCSICGKGFIQSHHLKTHLKTHDPAEWLDCEFPGCKKKFCTEYARKRHMGTHKLKPDSGISSDSSSCEATFSSNNFNEDSILCASCGESILESEYAKHSDKCGDIVDSPVDHFDSCLTDPLTNEFEQALPLESCKTRVDIKSKTISTTDPIIIESCKIMNDCKQEILKMIESKPIFDKDIGDCKTAPGGCIMGPEHCVCDEKSKNINNTFDFTLITSNANKTYDTGTLEYNEKEIIYDSDECITNNMNGSDLDGNNLKFFEKNYDLSNMCQGCDCASSCNQEPTICSIKNNKYELPNIEYQVDGVVRIKDTFDVDIPIRIKAEYKENIHKRFVPYSTCRDVIGNCISEGSEGCLCARMMLDDQQAMAQEIYDITPKPKTENY